MNDVLVIDCLSCGRAFVYRNDGSSGRFCSARCRQYFDAGGAYEPLDIDRYYRLPKGKHGFLIPCCGCGKQFDSTGLRCCSTECERNYRERQERQAAMLQAPVPQADVPGMRSQYSKVAQWPARVVDHQILQQPMWAKDASKSLGSTKQPRRRF